MCPHPEEPAGDARGRVRIMSDLDKSFGRMLVRRERSRHGRDGNPAPPSRSRPNRSTPRGRHGTAPAARPPPSFNPPPPPPPPPRDAPLPPAGAPGGEGGPPAAGGRAGLLPRVVVEQGDGLPQVLEGRRE